MEAVRIMPKIQMGKLSHRSQFGPFVVPALNQGFPCLWYDWFCRFELWLMWPQGEKKVAWSFFSKGWSLHQNSLSSGLLFHLGWQERWCQLIFRPQINPVSGHQEWCTTAPIKVWAFEYWQTDAVFFLPVLRRTVCRCAGYEQERWSTAISSTSQMSSIR